MDEVQFEGTVGSNYKGADRHVMMASLSNSKDTNGVLNQD